MNSRYEACPNYHFTQNDEKASKIFTQIQNTTRKQMPPTIYSPLLLTHLDEIKNTKIFSLMQTIPKGVLHHCHIDCCQDKQFFRQYVINDPIIYLTSDKKLFKIGTEDEATKNGWISMKELRKTFNSEDQMVDFVSNITMLNKEDYVHMAEQKNFWVLFERKIQDFFTIFYSLKHFKLYMRHVFEKFLKNQYDRLEWRALIVKLSEYDQKGNLTKTHDQKMFTQAIEEVYVDLKKQYPDFTIGVVFFGLLEWSQQQNGQVFRKVCDINWDKTLGIDVVQQEGPSLEPYVQTMKQVLSQYPHLNYKIVLHAGDTRDVENNNVQIALKAGSVRIGHGSNIIQKLQLLEECKKVCFQFCPVSSCVTGLREDIRVSHGSILMSLGVPISLSPDDPGKFGYEDSTVDFFMSMISYDWSLKDLKLLAIYSINHAICDNDEKKRLLQLFNSKWDKWIDELLKDKSLLQK